MDELVIKDESIYPEYQQWIDLMHQWGEIPDGQMDLKEQLTRLAQSFPISEHKIYVEDLNGEEQLVTVPLFQIQDIRIKSRRIIRMGDYYFTVNPQFLNEPQSAMKFYNKLESGDLIKAHHPHINDNGQPCLGEFQRHIGQLNNGNILYVVKAAKKFLNTHNYRSTFHNLRDNYDMDIIGYLKRERQDDEGNTIEGSGITEKVRVMGWKLAHQIRHHHRSSRHSSGRRLLLHSYRAGKVRAWLVRLMQFDITFTKAAKLIKKLQLQSGGEGTFEPDEEVIMHLQELNRWGYLTVKLGTPSYLHTDAEPTLPIEMGRIYLNSAQKLILQTHIRHSGNEDSISYMDACPWPEHLSDEETQTMIETGIWPDGYLADDNNGRSTAYLEAVFMYQSLVDEAKKLKAYRLKRELQRLGKVPSEPIKANNSTPNGRAHTISIEDLPRF